MFSHSNEVRLKNFEKTLKIFFNEQKSTILMRFLSYSKKFKREDKIEDFSL